MVTDTSNAHPGPRELLLTVVSATFVSLTLAVLVASVLQFLGKQIHGVEFDSSYWGMAFKAAVVGPLIETAVMGLMISLLFRPIFRHDSLVVVATALAWGILHGLFDIYWGIVIFFPFLVFAKVYLIFLRFSFWWSFGAATLNHALHNFLAVSWAYM